MNKQLEFYKDKDKQWRWRLRAKNNKIVADSAEGYHYKRDCKHGWDVLVDTILAALSDKP